MQAQYWTRQGPEVQDSHPHRNVWGSAVNALEIRGWAFCTLELSCSPYRSLWSILTIQPDYGQVFQIPSAVATELGASVYLLCCQRVSELWRFLQSSPNFPGGQDGTFRIGANAERIKCHRSRQYVPLQKKEYGADMFQMTSFVTHYHSFPHGPAGLLPVFCEMRAAFHFGQCQRLESLFSNSKLCTKKWKIDQRSIAFIEDL